MFSREKEKRIDPGKISTVLGAGTCVEGALTGDGSVRIDGFLKGSIDIAGDVVVAEKAKVQARICARAVKAAGTIQGDICSAGLVELEATAVVHGDVRCTHLVVDKGAVLNGSTKMGNEGSTDELPEDEPGGETQA